MALGGLDIADLAIPRTGTGRKPAAPGAPPNVEAALQRANERLTRVMAENAAIHAGRSDASPSQQAVLADPGADPGADPAGDSVRPLLQALVQRRENLGKVVEALALVDPVGQQTDRFLALLEEAITDVERAIETDRQPAPQPELPQPTTPQGSASMVALIARADLDPAQLFVPCATTNLRPAASVIVPASVMVPASVTVPVIAAVAAEAGPAPPRAKRRLRPGLIALLVLAAVVAPIGGISPDGTVPANHTQPAAAADDHASLIPLEPIAPSGPAAPLPQPAPPPAPQPQPASVDETKAGDAAIADLYAARGDDLLARKDISAARKFYELAVSNGNARAALAMARTYDPQFLAQAGVLGLRADAALADLWYRRAALLSHAKEIAQAETPTHLRAEPGLADHAQPKPSH
jgi:hypothetical protein